MDKPPDIDEPSSFSSGCPNRGTSPYSGHLMLREFTLECESHQRWQLDDEIEDLDELSDLSLSSVKDQPEVQFSAVKRMRQKLDVQDGLNAKDFWRNCSQWVSFSEGISLAHFMCREDERQGKQFQVFSSWEFMANYLITKTAGESPQYYKDSKGNYCMLVNTHSKYAETNRPGSKWNLEILKRWQDFEWNYENLDMGQKVMIRRQYVAVIRILPCKISLPPSSLYTRIDELFKVAERTPKEYTVPETEVVATGYEELERCAQTLILKIKGNNGIPIELLDIEDDPTWPILTDMSTLYLQKSLFTPENFFRDNYHHLCDVLSGDTFERQQWRNWFHRLDTHLIEEWKRSPMKREDQQAHHRNQSWKILFGDVNLGSCPYCGTTISYDAYLKRNYDASHIIPAIWGDFNDKHWWKTIPTCCNKSQPRNHMLVSLRAQNTDRLRFLVLQFFKRMLQHPCCELKTIGKSSLLGFTLGFYAIDAEPLVTDEWNFLFLEEKEVLESWKLLRGPRAQNF